MPRFFESVNSDVVIIKGENAVHITKSLRMSVGEELTICDNGMDYNCEVAEIGSNYVRCDIKSVNNNASEPNVKVTIYQCVPKGDKLEYVIQKAVELGAYRIVPVLSERCVSRPDEKSAAKKTERYQKIALSACEQSGRGRIVQVMPMISFKQAMQQLSQYDSALLFYEGGGEPLRSAVKKADNICIFIGPEGGFSESEVKQATNAGAVCATLGKRILRTETAPIVALSAVMLLTGNME